MADDITRIFSDLHYGDRGSHVHALAQVAPLFEGVGTVVLNGDTIDTRPGPYPDRTAAFRREVENFLAAAVPRVLCLTGNHDPDVSAWHAQEFAGGRVFVTHGDVLFSDIVPWSRDARLIRRRIATAQTALAPAGHLSLEAMLEVHRRICVGLEQRHQLERDPWKYLLSLCLDSCWPPQRFYRVLRAWRETPERAAALARAHRPKAQFIILGHLHRPGVWRSRDGRVIINTGSFCGPLGASLVDLSPGRIVVRRIISRNGVFSAGGVMAEFALAEA